MSYRELQSMVSKMPASDAVDYLMVIVADLMGETSKMPDWFEAVSVRLSPSERTLLRALIVAPHRRRSREALISAIYAERLGSEPDSNVIGTMIYRVRQKLPDFVSIRSISGFGYRLEVSEVGQ